MFLEGFQADQFFFPLFSLSTLTIQISRRSLLSGIFKYQSLFFWFVIFILGFFLGFCYIFQFHLLIYFFCFFLKFGLGFFFLKNLFLFVEWFLLLILCKINFSFQFRSSIQNYPPFLFLNLIFIFIIFIWCFFFSKINHKSRS
jgi:hypothetical protein